MSRFGWSVVLVCGSGALVVALVLVEFGMTTLRALFVGVNVATMLCFGYDKLRARAGMKRVPELVLHVLSISGGAPGALAGQLLFRHKTRDGRFQLIFIAIIFIQALILFALTRW